MVLNLSGLKICGFGTLRSKIVKSWLGAPTADTWAGLRLQSKLKHLRISCGFGIEQLLEMSHSSRRYCFTKIQELDKKEGLTGLSEQLRSDRIKFREEFHELVIREEIKWR